MTNPLRKYPELFTDTIFFIGNGSSRKNFDLNTLYKDGTIIGCNALYRDFTPDILICMDAKMCRELYDNKYNGLVLTGKGIGVKPSISVRWKIGNARTSGTFGLKFISHIMKPNKCYILGMDGYKGNVYNNTLNYSSDPVTKYSKITPQYIDAIKGSDTEFIHVNIKNTWEKGDYRFITYKEFKTELAD